MYSVFPEEKKENQFCVAQRYYATLIEKQLQIFGETEVSDDSLVCLGYNSLNSIVHWSFLSTFWFQQISDSDNDSDFFPFLAAQGKEDVGITFNQMK